MHTDIQRVRFFYFLDPREISAKKDFTGQAGFTGFSGLIFVRLTAEVIPLKNAITTLIEGLSVLFRAASSGLFTVVLCNMLKIYLILLLNPVKNYLHTNLFPQSRVIWRQA